MAPGSPASRWFENPPANDGSKVVITDTDHYAPGKGDALWAWKSFLRGHNPILMDFGIIDGVDPTGPRPSFEAFEPARFAMGDTLRYAGQMNLIAMEPRGELSSTGYVLANPGEEYLVLQPSESDEPFNVEFAAGNYTVQWYSITTRETKEAGMLTAASDKRASFTPPFAETGPVVLYLKQVGRGQHSS